VAGQHAVTLPAIPVQACGTYPLWARPPQERHTPAAERSRFATLVTAKNERVRVLVCHEWLCVVAELACFETAPRIAKA
jgi:hypothetical protein